MTFDDGREAWLARLGHLRNVVRQEMVARQLDAHLPRGRPLTVLDAGCGQGTQALRLARAGHTVTGLDSSTAMLDACREALADEPGDVAARIELLHGDVRDAPRILDGGAYDVVLCQGVLMYVEEPDAVLAGLARLVVAGGLLSVVARNGEALAMRPALRGRWADALAAFGSTSYVNEIGVTARADTVDGLAATLTGLGLRIAGWYGVRVLCDAAPVDQPPPSDPAELAALLDAEERAGRTDPYRRVAPLVHLVGRRPPGST